ncbi:MAG: LPS assembly lipoprotein LptE [Chlorobiota bacterium]
MLASCYSFTGGKLPAHLQTVALTPVVDNSGFGVPMYREYLTQRLLQRLQQDAPLRVVMDEADARLSVRLQHIRDVTQTVRPGELERERRAEVTVEAEFYDAVQRRVLWRRTFTRYELYEVAGGQPARDQAVMRSLDALCDDILLAIVSAW